MEEIADFLQEIVLSHASDVFFAILSLVLMTLYIAGGIAAPILSSEIKSVRRIRLFIRAFNWGLFGLVFLVFDVILQSLGILAWRTTARLALLSLMLAELAFQVAVFPLVWSEIKKWKLIHSFLSLLQ